MVQVQRLHSSSEATIEPWIRLVTLEYWVMNYLSIASKTFDLIKIQKCILPFKDVQFFSCVFLNQLNELLISTRTYFYGHSLYLLVKMAGRMKLFRFIQKYFRLNGIDPPDSNAICCGINWKSLTFFICEAQLFASLTAYLLIEAQSMLAYGMTFFAILHLVFGVVIYIIYFWKIEHCSVFIGNCENFIEKREY